MVAKTKQIRKNQEKTMKGKRTMNAAQIIQEWFRYSKYDAEQKKFDLSTNDYTFHKCNKNIGSILEYDPTGTLAVLYAKDVFITSLKNCDVSLFDVLSNPAKWAEEQDMWSIFNSPDVKEVESSLLDSVNQLVEQVADTKMIGERDKETERYALFESITSVVEQLDKCNIDLFLKGGSIKPITRFGTHIYVFEYLSECLLALEKTQDGMYLCYINNGGSADGYFGFYIKSNGNILSVNERVDEAYPGQHKRSRNGRWMEEKKFDLFPYSYIFSFSDYDYKGYAGKHMIDEEKLAFFNLEPKAYIPLLLAMIMLNTKYSNVSTADMKLKYVDSLLPVNIERPVIGTKALTVPSGSAVAAVNKSLDIAMSTEGVKNAEYSKLYNRSTNNGNSHYSELGCFPTEENIFVKLYGDDFVLDAYSLLEANSHLKRLTSADAASASVPDAEFVGSEKRMGLIAYQRAREQLAHHIREKMFEEYTAFGGKKAVEKWWDDVLKKNKDKLLELCVAKYNGVQDGRFANASARCTSMAYDEPLHYIDFQTECNGMVYKGISHLAAPLNNRHGYDAYGRPNGKYACIITGNLASIFFTFCFNNWNEIAEVFGEENIPKILKGWSKDRRGVGNSLLSVTDPVFEVGTPFERDEYNRNRRYWTQLAWQDYYFHSHDPEWPHKKPPKGAPIETSVMDFQFSIGFSKRGFNQLLKAVKEVEK